MFGCKEFKDGDCLFARCAHTSHGEANTHSIARVDTADPNHIQSPFSTQGAPGHQGSEEKKKKGAYDVCVHGPQRLQ